MDICHFFPLCIFYIKSNLTNIDLTFEGGIVYVGSLGLWFPRVRVWFSLVWLWFPLVGLASPLVVVNFFSCAKSLIYSSYQAKKPLVNIHGFLAC